MKFLFYFLFLSFLTFILSIHSSFKSSLETSHFFPMPKNITSKWWTNNTLKNNFAKLINSPMSFQSNSLKNWFHNHQYHLNDNQLDTIFNDLLSSSISQRTGNKQISKEKIQYFFNTFISTFDLCDTSHTNILNKSQFNACFTTDPYFKHILLSPQNNVSQSNAKNNTSKTENERGGTSVLFNLLDENKNNGITFNDYLILRIIRFSWSHCSSDLSFIEESNFKCAINIASGYRTWSMNTWHQWFELGLFLGDFKFTQSRKMDFVTYSYLVMSVRWYAMVNEMNDWDMKQSEMNSALNRNKWPSRYNSNIIRDLFMLVQDDDQGSKGMDIWSFVYYDYYLRIFDKPKFVNDKEKDSFWSKDEFVGLKNNYLFNSEINQSIVNGYNHTGVTLNLTSDKGNSDEYDDGGLDSEAILLSFIEIRSTLRKRRKNNKKVSVRTKKNSLENAIETRGITKAGKNPNRSLVSKKNSIEASNTNSGNATTSDNYKIIFDIIDHEGNGYLTFYDFGSFIQISTIFVKWDPLHNYRVTSSDWYHSISHFYDYPEVSSGLRHQASRFYWFDPSISFDLLSALTLLKVEDWVKPFQKTKNSKWFSEIDTRNFLKRLHWDIIPLDPILKMCVQDIDKNTMNNVYKWDCVFNPVLTTVMSGFNAQDNYGKTKGNIIN